MRPARNGVLSLPLALALSLAAASTALLPSGCGGGNASETADEPATEVDQKPVSERGKRWAGWRWKGNRQTCFFRHGNSCYEKLELACQAARCGESRCVHDEGAPAVVRCSK